MTRLLSLLFALAVLCAPSHAQLLKKLKKKAQEKIEKKAEEKISRRMDESPRGSPEKTDPKQEPQTNEKAKAMLTLKFSSRYSDQTFRLKGNTFARAMKDSYTLIGQWTEQSASSQFNLTPLPKNNESSIGILDRPFAASEEVNLIFPCKKNDNTITALTLYKGSVRLRQVSPEKMEIRFEGEALPMDKLMYASAHKHLTGVKGTFSFSGINLEKVSFDFDPSDLPPKADKPANDYGSDEADLPVLNAMMDNSSISFANRYEFTGSIFYSITYTESATPAFGYRLFFHKNKSNYFGLEVENPEHQLNSMMILDKDKLLNFVDMNGSKNCIALSREKDESTLSFTEEDAEKFVKTSRKKKVMGYSCTLYTLQEEEGTSLYWITEQIDLPNIFSPTDYQPFKGMILEFETYDGKQKTKGTATSIDLKKAFSFSTKEYKK
ncbi:MAG: DUF4412 domain-containing protein [Cytophagales bacterium]|nr:DUF4412 domain-containing protein [Cytophagales bacterium]